MIRVILCSFLISFVLSQTCSNDNQCSSNGYCDLALMVCKCNHFYYGTNCQNNRPQLSAVSPLGDIMVPFAISYVVIFTTVLILGLTIIYFCFKDSLDNVDGKKEDEQPSKTHIDKEYHLTQNKAPDTEANLIQKENEQKRIQEDKVNKSVKPDNSYQIVNKKEDPEADPVVLHTEAMGILEKDHDNRI